MRTVQVRALKSFDGLVAGELYWFEMSERLAHLIVNMYLRLVFDPGEEVTHDSPSEGDLPPGHQGS